MTGQRADRQDDLCRCWRPSTFNPGDVEEVNVVYVGHGGRLPARVRALIDFLVDEVDLDDASDLFE